MSEPLKLTKTFSFDGQSVAYDTFGSGEAIVLVHGTTSRSESRTGCSPPWSSIWGSIGRM
jgi:hypothetical protein